MERKLLVDEETFVELVAQVTVDQHMVELLMAYFVRTLPPHERASWLNDRQKMFVGDMVVPTARSESHAVLLSDIAVQVRERGEQLVARLRDHLEADAEWESAERLC